ncbi:hypothetical protein GCM10022243_40270 [Saccharothrix violaceirubra]
MPPPQNQPGPYQQPGPYPQQPGGYPQQQPGPYGPPQPGYQQPWPQMPPRAVMPPPVPAQQPGWGQQPPGWPQQYQPYPPLRRKSNSGPIVAAVIVGVVVLGIAAIGVFASLTRHKTTDDASYSGYSTYTYSVAPTTTTTNRTTTQSTTRPSATTRPSPSTTAKAGPKAVVALGDNPIHGNDLGAFDIDGCALPPMDYSVAGQERFLRAALPCIEAMWKPSFTKANLPYQPVELTMVTSQVTNACGTVSPDRTAVYCEGGIFWTPLHYSGETGNANPNHPGKYLGQLAHEYGHHVQWLSGILRAASQAQYDKGGWDTPAGLELNRRKELQATCFGGMTLAPLSHGAIPTDVIQVALTDAGNRGDYPVYPNRDHGAPERNAAWVQHGYKNNSTSACNTWTASAADVS